MRRRRTDPPIPNTPRPPNTRNWLIYAILLTFVAVLMLEGYLADHRRNVPIPRVSEATEVSSTIYPAGDSLQIVVSWDLTLSTPEGHPDSIRISVVPASGKDTLIAMRPATVFSDTAYLPMPAPEETLTGSSCVLALHPAAAPLHPPRPPTEMCTPWQYVRPTVPVLASTATGTIVIQPSGLQVDPDIGGRCAEWQRNHPGESVWARVNRSARRECTGANGKPTVAQFCAFMVLSDGRKIRTANSVNTSYCEELFVEWMRERYS